MDFGGRGHPGIRATHAKTLEFTADPQVSERGTCIVAVGAELPTEPLAGPLRVTISAGGESFELDADGNSSWRPGGALVIRREPLRLPGTFAINASALAADLPRPLVAELQRPDALVEVRVERRPGPPTVVLAALDPLGPEPGDDPRLAAELAAADRVHRELPARLDGRVLVLLADGLPDSGTALAGVRVETVGLAPQLAAAAAAPWPGAVLLGESEQLLRRAPAGVRLVLPVAGRDPRPLLRRAAEERGSTHAVLAHAWGDPRLVAVDEAQPVPGAQRLYCCLGPAPDAGLDPAVRAAVSGLLADGVPTRTAAKALAALTGWERRRAYTEILDWPT